ncbi:MAG TPA: SUMF1/EgtB/PvdO family nonheme iron enzyme [Thermotogota bacterium]|nr:SUMF1/EgtB/PvdO family nonheme iron enzyme [Thermotogota bacterium]
MKKGIMFGFVVLGGVLLLALLVGCTLPENQLQVEVSLVEPLQAQEGVGLHPEFAWDVRFGNTSSRDLGFFKLYVAPVGEDFGEGVQTQQTRASWNRDLLAGTSYHWKVEGWWNGKCGATSDEGNFSTQNYYSVEVVVAGTQGGQVRVEGSDWGDSIVVQAGLDSPTRLWALPEEDYLLDGWYLGEQLLSAENPFDYLPEHPASTPRDGESDIRLDVKFRKLECTITAQASPSEHGSVRMNDGEWGDWKSVTVQAGDEVSLQAEARADYHFAGWYEELASGSRGTKVSDENPYRFQAQGDRTLRGAFEIDTYTITVKALPDEQGNVRINNGAWGREQQLEVPVGQQVQTKALALTGFHFSGWFENDQLLSTENPYSFALQNDRVLEGRFERDYPASLLLVGAGIFRMGDTLGDPEADADEKPAHWVTLTYDFLVGKTEVTFAEYDAYCEGTGTEKPDDEGWGREDRPVINVSWWDALAYCNWRSEQEGFPVAYRLFGEPQAGSLLDANGVVTKDLTKVKGYRLLTEAEWEYCARGGHVDITEGVEAHDYKYAGSNTMADVAWYSFNSLGKTHPVKGKQANELGLFDMSGNVFEWCYDWHDQHWYSVPNQVNPIGPETGSDRIFRGGSWEYLASMGRVTGFRFYFSPTDSDNILGFRIARSY